MSLRLYSCLLIALLFTPGSPSQAEDSNRVRYCESLLAPAFNKRTTLKLANRLYHEISEALWFQGSYREAEADSNLEFYSFLPPRSFELRVVNLNQIRLIKILFERYRGYPLTAENLAVSEMQGQSYEPLRLLLIYLVGTRPMADGLLTPEHLQYAKSLEVRSL